MKTSGTACHACECVNVPMQFLYITYGTRDFLEKKCRDLPQKVRLWLDGEPKDLEHLEAITVLNIPCWGAGVRPWHMGAGGQLAQPQRYVQSQ
ncbi:hypothetical protein HPB52_023473 [Rhipicephalus sanguineus]|uniref:Diacylglycerol kinase accessory domain-containing protein n=1 Tax=Rhipicephalus sanguineus TaxID=34632 RepID=A0A9D4PSM6_RHISA|nr:hypothetical protein HPB52_023473 [Rhipicephalus sanguineus]